MVAKPKKMVYVHLYLKWLGQDLAAEIQQYKTKKCNICSKFTLLRELKFTLLCESCE